MSCQKLFGALTQIEILHLTKSYYQTTEGEEGCKGTGKFCPGRGLMCVLQILQSDKQSKRQKFVIYLADKSFN